MTPQQFISKWSRAELSERSACQQHFLDLCELLGQPKPAEADPEGAWYTFERGVHKTAGGQGWADVGMRDHFGWEYKGKHKDLSAAYNQLLQYRESLGNPPHNPVLAPIESIRLMDAVLDLSDPDHSQEPDWPAADLIVAALHSWVVARCRVRAHRTWFAKTSAKSHNEGTGR